MYRPWGPEGVTSHLALTLLERSGQLIDCEFDNRSFLVDDVEMQWRVRKFLLPRSFLACRLGWLVRPQHLLVELDDLAEI